jgi:excinuclease ABC subunit B
MRACINETYRRREIQNQYNIDNGVVPATIIKPIYDPISNSESIAKLYTEKASVKSKKQLEQEIKELRKLMKKYADEFNFEKAIELREIIFELKAKLDS